MTNQSPNSYFAPDENEAKRRFEEYRSKDPFPDIAPALLNSADIYDYVAKTGMIYPFYPNKLKSAAYPVSILGKLLYWDEQDEKQIQNIQQSDEALGLQKKNRIEKLMITLGLKQGNQRKEFTLKKNSIVFVTLEPQFCLPDYIAIRFNLKIKHIYRGLLLGTGPLVDPGFTGRLSIPLHNLTNSDYVFSAEEELIWMEFTKLSPNKRWKKSIIGSNSRQGNYIEFRNDSNRDVEYYLSKANENRPIRSSIPEVFKNAEKAAKDASSTVKFFQGVGGLSAIALIIALGALFFQVFSLVREKDDLINKTNNQLESLQEKIANMQTEINGLKQKLNNAR